MARARLRSLTRIAGKVSWGFADQAVSSLSNFLLGFLVARATDTASFGAFSIAYTTYIVVIGIARGAIAQPLLVRYSDASEHDWRAASGRAAGFALATGLVVAAGCAAVAVVIGGTVGNGFMAVAVILPGLMVQDTWRYALFAHDRGRSAFLNDLAWLAVQVPALAIALAGGRDVGVVALLAWGLAGIGAALLGGRQVGVRPHPKAAMSWLREHRVLIPRYVAETTASLTSSQLSLYGIGALAGLTTAGELRIGQLLIGPIMVIFIGVQLVALPQAVRALGRSIATLQRVCVIVAVVTAAIAIAWGVAISLVPDDIGRTLLGENWAAGKPLVLLLALGLAASSLSGGALIGLRALAAATRSLRATVISSTLTTVATIVGAMMFGAAGAAWGIVLAHVATIGLWWWEFHRGAQAYAEAGEADARTLQGGSVS